MSDTNVGGILSWGGCTSPCDRSYRVTWMSAHTSDHGIIISNLAMQYSNQLWHRTGQGCPAGIRWMILSEQQVDTSKPNYLVLYRRKAAKEPEPLPVINAVRECALNPRIHRNAIGKKK
jgi:hypothetical protein